MWQYLRVRRNLTKTCIVVLVVCSQIGSLRAEDTQVYVDSGKARAVEWIGEPWTSEEGSLQGQGFGNTLYATDMLGKGDAIVTATLVLPENGGTDAAFILNGHDSFEFQTSNDRIRTHSRGVLLEQGKKNLGKTSDYIVPGKPFEFTFKRRDGRVSFAINDQVLYEKESGRDFIGMIGFRPGSGLRIVKFEAEGNLEPIDLPKEQINLYVSGEGGYHTYRIPSIIRTSAGSLLAFAEGRRYGRADYGEIHLLMRRSTDDGRTWSEPIVVWRDGESTCGNPCPVVDQSTGRIWLPMIHNPAGYAQFRPETFTHGTRTVWITYSDDDGKTWADPKEITESTKLPEWEWYATGPGVSIQLTKGPHAGRLVIPANFSLRPMKEGDYQSGNGSLAILSDDYGRSWRRSSVIGDRVSENQIVELADGRLMANMRSQHGNGRRYLALSEDGGETWSAPRRSEFRDPVNQASLLRYDWPSGDQPGQIVFQHADSETLRERLTLRVSEDEGETWHRSRQIYPGFAAYTSLVVLGDGTVGCLYERDDYGMITLARVPIDSLASQD